MIHLLKGLYTIGIMSINVSILYKNLEKCTPNQHMNVSALCL